MTDSIFDKTCTCIFNILLQGIVIINILKVSNLSIKFNIDRNALLFQSKHNKSDVHMNIVLLFLSVQVERVY